MGTVGKLVLTCEAAVMDTMSRAALIGIIVACCGVGIVLIVLLVLLAVPSHRYLSRRRKRRRVEVIASPRAHCYIIGVTVH